METMGEPLIAKKTKKGGKAKCKIFNYCHRIYF